MTGPESIVVESSLTRADVAALQKAWRARARARVGTRRLRWVPLAPVLLALALVFALGEGNTPFALGAFLLGACGTFLGTTWAANLFQRQSLPDEDGAVLGRVRMELSSEGIRALRDDSDALTRWSALRDVSLSEAHLFLWIDRTVAYILPLRDLPSGLGADAVVESIRGWTGPPASTGESQVAAAPRKPAPEPGLGGDATPEPGFLATLARRLTWRSVPTEGAASSDAMILACAAVALAVWLAFDRHTAGPGAQWYFGGVVGIAWYAVGLLALAWVLHRASHRLAGFRTMLASVLGGLPLPLAVALGVHNWAPEGARAPVYALLCIAAAVYVRRCLAAATGGAFLAYAMPAAVLLAVVFAQATGEAWVYPNLWYAAESEEDASDSWTESERLLFEQADRIDGAAASLDLGQPGRPDVFFVGFAGVAEEKVFAEEIRLAETVISERYDTGGRTLLLVNDRRDRETYPMATVHGLRRALARVGERMDRSEDVLFLMLTSHGSDEPSLSVSNGAWPLEQLDAETLRSLLDESLIKWRVIVISACHSGAFIGPLADANSIVLTAAAGDRVSFGCSDQREVTEFGAALVRDALPEAESLAGAFEQAKRAVAERERREGLTPSLPQAHFGQAIRAHWKRIEAERRTAEVSSDVG